MINTDQDEMVSIITPSYNTVNYIYETVLSVVQQTYNNWEMIIVDDHSTDGSVKRIQEIICEFRNKRIKLIINKQNRGAAFSRNLALREAKGKWIAFLDSDDIWLPYKLEKQIRFMKDTKSHFSYTKYSEIDEDSKQLGRIISGPKKITKTGMYNYCWPGCLTVMYEADYVGLIQIADIQKNNDYAMWLKVVNVADCYLLNEILALYRKRIGSISNQRYSNLIKWHFRLFRSAEKQNVVTSIVLTVRNLFCGSLKKIIYVKKVLT